MPKSLITISILLVTIISISNARVLNVPADFKTIAEGIDSASTKDTVLVAPGQYYEGINFKGKKIIVASNYLLAGDTSFIRKTVIRNSLVPPDSCVRYNTKRNVVIFDSTESNQSVFTGFMVLDEYVWVSNKSNPLIKSIIICGTRYPEFSSCFLSGMQVNSSVYTVSGIEFINTSLYLRPVVNTITVKGNVFKSSSISQDANRRKSIIDNNLFLGSSISQGATGTYLDSTEIKNNSFIDSRLSLGGTGEAHHYAQINNNRFFRDTASFTGVYISGTGSCIVNTTVAGNTFVGCNLSIGGTGDFLVNAHISRNVFTHVTGAAIRFNPISLSAYDCKFINNTVVGNSIGISVDDTVGKMNIINCIIWGNGNDMKGVRDSLVSYSLFNTPFTSSNNGNISGNPLLIDTARLEFGLQKRSPCINQGDPLQPPDPDNSRCDIGAIPFDNSVVYTKSIGTTEKFITSIAYIQDKVLYLQPLSKINAPNAVFIYDMKGRKVCNWKLPPEILNIDLKKIPLCSGSFIVHITRNASSVSLIYLKP